MNEQSELKKAYANLIAIKDNLPQRHELEVKFANLVNSEVDRLSRLGLEVEDFKIPANEIKSTFIGGNLVTGETHYSKEKYVEKEILLIKLDAILTYFSIENQNIKIGFNIY